MGDLITNGIRLTGVDGEEFGAGAERTLTFLKVVLASVPPFLNKVHSFCLINAGCKLSRR